MPDADPIPEVDTLELLRGHVNDLAAAFGRDVGELREQWAALTGASAYRVEVVQAERTTITPADAILVRLPSEAFEPAPGSDESVAEVISRVLADVLGTRRVVVIEDAAKITIAPMPPEGFPLIGVEPGRPFAAVEGVGDGTFRPIYLDVPGAFEPRQVPDTECQRCNGAGCAACSAQRLGQTGPPPIDGPTGG